MITPAVATVQPGATQQFTAQVSGQIVQTVTWSVPAGEGSITSSGLYTAPSNTGSFSVVATSSVDANSSATANVVVTTALPGNWQFTGLGSRQISASLILTNTIITGTAHIFFNLAGCSGFFQPIPLTGTINAQDNISVTSSVVDGSVLSFTGTLSPDHSSISGGTYRFRGGCVDGESGPLTGVQVSQVVGVYSGTMAGGPNGSVAVSALLTQSQSTDVNGFFPVNGTVAVASSACPASFSLYGAVVVGNVIYLYSNTGSGLQGLSGTVDFGATQISLYDYLYLGDCIAGASGTLQLQ
ncbi:MAG: hypothetical protein LAO03_21360 [Acidobacteriia bacterium]|nr:hypothetical protein [Terriglobia bacterium]